MLVGGGGGAVPKNPKFSPQFFFSLSLKFPAKNSGKKKIGRQEAPPPSQELWEGIYLSEGELRAETYGSNVGSPPASATRSPGNKHFTTTRQLSSSLATPCLVLKFSHAPDFLSAF